MYRTHIDCKSAGPFGKMVVSMRPMPCRCDRSDQSAPGIHPSTAHRFIWVIRKPSALLIWRSPTSVTPSIRTDDVPLFWACGVTPQVALESARLPIAVTHEQGHMLVTDLKNAELAS